MEQVYNATLQERVERYVKQAGSQGKAARAMGVSESMLSQYRRSTYKGSVPDTEAKFDEFFAVLDEQAEAAEKAMPYQPVLDSYLPTSISEDIYKAIRFCQLQKGICVLHGDAGIGKTMAAEKYAQDNPTTAIYLQASPVAGSVGNILHLICQALKIPEGRSKLDMIINIKERLDGTSMVLIIDEGQHLQTRALDELRPLSDPHMSGGRRGIGIVLIGNSEVYDRMLGNRQRSFAQLYSRIRMNRAYRTQQVKPSDIELLFPALAGQKKELQFLHGICQSLWGIRGGVNVYNNAVSNEDISITGLTGMAQQMGITVM